MILWEKKKHKIQDLNPNQNGFVENKQVAKSQPKLVLLFFHYKLRC